MISAAIKINEKRLKERLRAKAINAFVDTVNQFAIPLRESIEAWVYPWPRLTLRSSGDLVGSPRDIVDTGALRDSQILIFESATSAYFSWGVDYALQVHEGMITKSGEMPARRWTEHALDEYDIREIFINNLRKYL